MGRLVVAGGAAGLVLLLLLAAFGPAGDEAGAATPTSTRTATVAPSRTPAPTPGVSRRRIIAPLLARDGPRRQWPTVLPCGDILVPVDLVRHLPADCVPPLVALPGWYSVLFGDTWLGGRPEAVAALTDMVFAAAAEGIALRVRSAYRSFEHQAALYAYWVALLGEEQAARTSARPGHSEHQLGTAFDLATPENGYGFETFGETAAGAWVAANSWRFGFVVSFPEGREHITGYDYEPWHVRYIGPALAAEQRNSGLTLREFLIARGP